MKKPKLISWDFEPSKEKDEYLNFGEQIHIKRLLRMLDNEKFINEVVFKTEYIDLFNENYESIISLNYFKVFELSQIFNNNFKINFISKMKSKNDYRSFREIVELEISSINLRNYEDFADNCHIKDFEEKIAIIIENLYSYKNYLKEKEKKEIEAEFC